MKKKIIFLAVCAVLLLFFASSSYGELDPKYVLMGHPWSDPCLAPAGDTTVNVLMLSIGPNTILTFTLNGIKSTTKNINQSNINREKWITTPKESAKRLPQR